MSAHTLPNRLPHRFPHRLPGWVAVGAAALVLTSASCGSSAGDAGGADEPEAPADSPGALPEGAEELAGRWAHFDVVAYDDPVMKTLIISTGFADLEVRDGELWNTQRFCHADMGNDAGIGVTMPDAATQAIVPVDTPVEVSVTDDGRLRVVRPPTPTPIGIRLNDPANETLPTDPDDPRVFDHDGDGKPGVTATIEVADGVGGELYIARREIFSYDVTQESPDRMVGSITDRSEQLVVGASDPIFAAQTTWTQYPDPSRNPVIWQRVDDTWDCERLAAERDELFPPNPEVDW
ncbi:MAG: hypothetical protein KDB10_02780 [Acidimicrobiales bacterium]|nr:hypothetical protein [Acidimicrobiales bacterium]